MAGRIARARHACRIIAEHMARISPPSPPATLLLTAASAAAPQDRRTRNGRHQRHAPAQRFSDLDVPASDHQRDGRPGQQRHADQRHGSCWRNPGVTALRPPELRAGYAAVDSRFRLTRHLRRARSCACTPTASRRRCPMARDSCRTSICWAPTALQIMRGPFSALYGNSSGGVVQIWSRPGTEDLRAMRAYHRQQLRTLAYGAQALGTAARSTTTSPDRASRPTAIATIRLRGATPPTCGWASTPAKAAR